MLDARNIYRKVTRKIYDFSPEQLQNLTAIVWLYRGQTDRFLALVQSYLDRTIAEAAAIARKRSRRSAQAYDALVDAAAPFLEDAARMTRPLTRPADGARRRGRGVFPVVAISGPPASPRNGKNHARRSSPPRRNALRELDALAEACRDLVKDVDLVCKLAARLVDAAENRTPAPATTTPGTAALSGGWKRNSTPGARKPSNNSSGPPTFSARPTGCSRDFPTPSL